MMGSSKGEVQLATLMICGVSRTDIGAAFMPSSTSARKSSRVLIALCSVDRPSGIREGKMRSRNARSFSGLSMVFAF